MDNVNETINEIKNETKPKEKTNTKDNSDNKLVIGLNDKNKELFIPEKSRYFNTLVLGTKATGKTTSLLPMFVEQDLKRKDAGMTIICSSKEMSYNLYSLAKKYKRKISFLKPSINNEISNNFLWLQDYNYDYINEQIINYKEAIKKKEVVIIDMEILKYKGDALKAVAMLLLQLRLDIQETDITQRCSHFLYVDDAFNYLKFLEDLLIYSDNYNLGITLFMQSREQFITKNKDYRPLIANNIRNTLLLNNITIEDYNYYKDKFFEKCSPSDFYNREFNTILYETIDSVGVRRVGISRFKKLLIGDWDELESKSKKIRASLLKEKRKQRELELKEKYQKSLEKTTKEVKEVKIEPKENLSKEPKPINQDLLTSIASDVSNIRPREFNIKSNKTKETPKRTDIVVQQKEPTFNPPKTKFDKHTPVVDLSKDFADLGSILPKQEKDKKDNPKPFVKVEQNKEKDNEIVAIKPIVQEPIIKEEIEDMQVEQNVPIIEEPIIENALEIQKKKEEEALRIQEEIERKIKEQIMNEEKERKKIIATNIFNNYKETIDYCDEVFDFKYD